MISKDDIRDLELVDSFELKSSGSDPYRTETIKSISSGPKKIELLEPNPFFTIETSGNDPVEVNDRVTITGSITADGTYTVASILGTGSFTVKESISSATTGSITFRYPSGAKKVGFDSSLLIHTSASNVQDAIKDLDIKIVTGGSRVGLLIFKVDGGLVYDSNGHPQLKVNE